MDNGARTLGVALAIVKLEILMTLKNGQGKTVHFGIIPMTGQPKFGLESIRGISYFKVPDALPPGTYDLCVVVKDVPTTEEVSFQRKVRLKATEFAFRSIGLFYDEQRTVPAASTLQVGHKLYFEIDVLGFSTKDNKGELALKLLVDDQKTKRALYEDATGSVPIGRSAQPGAYMTIYGEIGLMYCPGDFVLRFEVTDRVVHKTIHLEVPLHVLKGE